MIKKILQLIIPFMIISMIASANEISQLIANIAPFQIVINGHQQQLENSVVEINGKTYVPLRELSVALNKNVEWSEKEQKITINDKEKYIGDGSDLFAFRKDGLYGYMDKYGKIWIEPKFDHASDFSEGYGIVTKSDEATYSNYEGVIDTNGNLVIPYKYRISSFRGGLATVIEQKDGETYYIDKEGKNVFGKTFPQASEFSCGLAPVIKKGYPWPTENEKWTYIDKTGKYATNMEFDMAYDFSTNGFAVVEKNGKWAIIDRNFNMITGYIYDDIWDISGDGYVVAEKTGKYGVVNTKGKTIIEFNYELLRGFNEGLCAAVKDGKYGYIDINNNIVIPFRYKWALEFNYGIASVQDENGKWGIINKKGEYLLEPKYDSISTCDRGLIKVTDLMGGMEGQVNWEDHTYYINTKFEKVEPHN